MNAIISAKILLIALALLSRNSAASSMAFALILDSTFSGEILVSESSKLSNFNFAVNIFNS